MTVPTLWIASYPRSGNTLVRIILFQCFGLRSGSIYPNDLDGRPAIERATGHVEHDADGWPAFADQPFRPIKTHGPPADQAAAIYIVRNGLDATRSLHAFYSGARPYRRIIGGKRPWYRRLLGNNRSRPTWADNLSAWQPRERPNTLFLRYEDVAGDTAAAVEQIGVFLKLAPLSTVIPARDDLAGADGRWIRPEGAQGVPLAGADLERFWRLNGTAMREYGYS